MTFLSLSLFAKSCFETLDLASEVAFYCGLVWEAWILMGRMSLNESNVEARGLKLT